MYPIHGHLWQLLKDLFIDSEGTLGITTQIKLRLLPRPKATLSLIAAFDTLEDATNAVLTILRYGVDPTAMEFFEREAIALSEKENKLAFPSQKGQAYLLITLDGDSNESIEQRVKLLEQSVLNHHCIELLPLTDPSQEHIAWFLRDQLLTSVVSYSEQVTMDEVVPVNHIATLYNYTKVLEEESGLKLIYTLVLREVISKVRLYGKKNVTLFLKKCIKKSMNLVDYHLQNMG